jgi:hypothetical protein
MKPTMLLQSTDRYVACCRFFINFPPLNTGQQIVMFISTDSQQTRPRRCARFAHTQVPCSFPLSMGDPFPRSPLARSFSARGDVLNSFLPLLELPHPVLRFCRKPGPPTRSFRTGVGAEGGSSSLRLTISRHDSVYTDSGKNTPWLREKGINTSSIRFTSI